MKDKINDKLSQIEKEYDVTILSARDFGSTAWNLDGPDSDRDVAFVFKQPKIEYAKIGDYQENIDRMFEIEGKEHSFMGWNLKRFMELLDGSNPTIIEFLNSDVIYYDSGAKTYINGEWVPEPTEEQLALSKTYLKVGEVPEGTFEELEEHVNSNFKPISIFYHYRSLAKDNYNQYIKNENHKTVKRYIYVLRALLYARYVEETHRMPDLDFVNFLNEARDELVRKGIVEERIVKEAEKLAGMKKNGKGRSAHRNDNTDQWIESELDNNLDNDRHNIRGIDTDLLNDKMEMILDED